MKAVITAGGQGTRLATVTSNLIPKPMVPLCGRPIIEHIVDNLIKSGADPIIIILGHFGKQIEAYLGDGSEKGVEISYIYETEPLGTAGGLFYIKDKIQEDFIFVYADVLMDIDLNRMHAFHISRNAEATLFVHPNSHPFDSDLVIADEDGRVLGFDYKGNIRNYDYNNCINAGVFIFKPEFLNRISAGKKLDLEKHVIAAAVLEGAPVYAYRSPEYIKDVGTPERLLIAEGEYRAGIVTQRNLHNRQAAVFLDRDGTINVYKGLIREPSGIQLLPGVEDAIRALNQSRYLSIIITNQPVIARGECSFEGMESIHKRLITLLGKSGVYVDTIQYCPHHPDSGYEGEVAALKFDCNCRKPKTGLITQCVEQFNIDLRNSWFIGDTYRDIQTGENAGMRTILISTSTGADQEKERFTASPTYEAATLTEAIQIILNIQ